MRSAWVITFFLYKSVKLQNIDLNSVSMHLHNQLMLFIKQNKCISNQSMAFVFVYVTAVAAVISLTMTGGVCGGRARVGGGNGAHVPWLAVYLPAIAASLMLAALSILSVLRSGGYIIADANNLNYFVF